MHLISYRDRAIRRLRKNPRRGEYHKFKRSHQGTRGSFVLKGRIEIHRAAGMGYTPVYQCHVPQNEMRTTQSGPARSRSPVSAAIRSTRAQPDTGKKASPISMGEYG